MILPRAAGEGDHGVVEAAPPDSVCAFAPSTACGGPPPPFRCASRGKIS